ncbi:hypothetical protein ACIRG5_44160 [Lentzea sp. NPDC102401]|uniref:hypothetical protein n=1 Tax=Lentzea sp. NPDC102401 TaxID=3364128 RepID=UPI0038057677
MRARDFPDFATPGFGKVRTLFSSEIRVTLTDPPAWLRFHRYWRISTPAVWIISRAVLRTIKHNRSLGPPVSGTTGSAPRPPVREVWDRRTGEEKSR